MKSIVGIGEFAVSDSSINTLKTFALASCVAVTAYSPSRKRGAMIHVALPTPGSAADASAKPTYYATTGIPIMIDSLCSQYGCTKQELEIQIFGGAESINRHDLFHIGTRNIKAVLSTLQKLNLEINKAEVGGKVSRTVEMNTITGDINISTHPITI